MKDIVKLFRLLETTRAQLQYGYVLAEIPKSQISDLAQHHFLVTFFAWQLTGLIKQAGGTINSERVLEICLMHDLGELFGGDISMPYANTNPAAKKLAKAFELENLKYFSQMFVDQEINSALIAEATDPQSDEGIIAKVADHLEVAHYRLYVRQLTAGDITMATKRLQPLINKMSNKIARQTVDNFLQDWSENILEADSKEVFENAKKI